MVMDNATTPLLRKVTQRANGTRERRNFISRTLNLGVSCPATIHRIREHQTIWFLDDLTLQSWILRCRSGVQLPPSAGAPIITAAALLGHDATIYAYLCAHLYDDDASAAINAMNRVLGGAE